MGHGGQSEIACANGLREHVERADAEDLARGREHPGDHAPSRWGPSLNSAEFLDSASRRSIHFCAEKSKAGESFWNPAVGDSQVPTRVRRHGSLSQALGIVRVGGLILIALLVPTGPTVRHGWSEIQSDAVLGDSIFGLPSDSVHSTSSGPSYEDTSEYLIGRVAVGIFLVESDGAAYDWLDGEVSVTLEAVEAGFDWWAEQEPAARLSFAYEIHIREPTNWEPIQSPQSEENHWIDEIMEGHGYAEFGPWDKVLHYNNDLRDRLGTDWAFSMFIVDNDANEDDGTFSDGERGHAYYGGPWMAVVRDGWPGYTPAEYLRSATAHELGHIFYATDEYDGVLTQSGYLNCPDEDGALGLMNDGTFELSPSTRCQVGWLDHDGDGVLDILDQPPETTLVAQGPTPTADCQLRYTGNATVVALDNLNSWSDMNDITLSRITGVEFRVDGGPWSRASAADGAFDGFEEVFSFVTPPLTPGLHRTEVRSRNTEGNADLTPAFDNATTEGLLCSGVDQLPGYAMGLSFTVSASTIGTAVSVELWYSYEGGAYQLYAADAEAPWEWTFRADGMGDGRFTFHSMTSDAGGGREDPPPTPDTATTVDTGPPALSLIGARPWINVTFFDLAWLGNDETSGILGYELSLDGGPPTDVGARTVQAFLYVSVGSHVANVTARDRAGLRTTVVHPFGVDPLPPFLRVLSPRGGQTVAENRVVVLWSVTDAISGVDQVEIRLDDLPFVRPDAGTRYEFLGVPDGAHTVTLRALDAAANLREVSVSFQVNTDWLTGGGPWGWIPVGLVVATCAILLTVPLHFLRRRRPSRGGGDDHDGGEPVQPVPPGRTPPLPDDGREGEPRAGQRT